MESRRADLAARLVGQEQLTLLRGWHLSSFRGTPFWTNKKARSRGTCSETT